MLPEWHVSRNHPYYLNLYFFVCLFGRCVNLNVCKLNVYMMLTQFMLCLYIYIYIYIYILCVFVLWSILWQNSINSACMGPTRCQIIGYCRLSGTTFADLSSYRLPNYWIFWIIRWHLTLIVTCNFLLLLLYLGCTTYHRSTPF